MPDSVLLDPAEWSEVYYAVAEFSTGYPDDLIGVDGQDADEDKLTANDLRRFADALRAKQLSIAAGEYDIPCAPDCPEPDTFPREEWMPRLAKAEQKLRAWVEIKRQS